MDSNEEVISSVKVYEDAISTLHRCNIAQVRQLCIFDLDRKLKYPSDYDIGGCYSPEPELWFFYTTSVCPGYNYLLSLYACHRKAGNFTIDISNSNQFEVMSTENEKTIKLLSQLKRYTFVSGAPDECHFIKTFCFSEKDVAQLDKAVVFIPLQITTDTNTIVDPDFVKKIKLSHDFGKLLESKKGADLVIESTSGQRYDCHKILVASQSPVLKDMINSQAEDVLRLSIDDKDVELLLKFIYTGAIDGVLEPDCCKLLELARTFDIKGLISIAEYAIGELINVDNAVATAVLAEKYSLDVLLKLVFDFIKMHPEVMETEGWAQLDDIKLTKKMLLHIHKK